MGYIEVTRFTSLVANLEISGFHVFPICWIDQRKDHFTQRKKGPPGCLSYYTYTNRYIYIYIYIYIYTYIHVYNPSEIQHRYPK